MLKTFENADKLLALIIALYFPASIFVMMGIDRIRNGNGREPRSAQKSVNERHRQST